MSNRRMLNAGFECKMGLWKGIEELAKAYMMMPGSEFTNT